MTKKRVLYKLQDIGLFETHCNAVVVFPFFMILEGLKMTTIG